MSIAFFSYVRKYIHVYYYILYYLHCLLTFILFLDNVYFPAARNESQRYRCDSNSSVFMYSPQTRGVHLIINNYAPDELITY